MTLGELKQFISNLPKEMDEFYVMNGEIGYLDPEDDNSAVYRLDKPIIALYIDEASKEICLFHQTQEDVTKIMNDGNSKES
jgi:hypothetical protein